MKLLFRANRRQLNVQLLMCGLSILLAFYVTVSSKYSRSSSIQPNCPEGSRETLSRLQTLVEGGQEVFRIARHDNNSISLLPAGPALVYDNCFDPLSAEGRMMLIGGHFLPVGEGEGPSARRTELMRVLKANVVHAHVACIHILLEADKKEHLVEHMMYFAKHVKVGTRCCCFCRGNAVVSHQRPFNPFMIFCCCVQDIHSKLRFWLWQESHSPYYSDLLGIPSKYWPGALTLVIHPDIR